MGESSDESDMRLQNTQARQAIHARSVAAENTMLDQQRGNNRELDGLDERIDRLTLLCEAMWELLVDAGATPEALANKLNELDMADGRKDLKRKKLPVRCDCGAMVPPVAKVCQFCSQPPPDRSFFDPV